MDQRDLLDRMTDPANMIPIVIPAIGFFLALLCMIYVIRAGRRRRLIRDLPTCKTTGIFMGLVELKGTAEAVRPLVSYLTERLCVYYMWEISEQWSRTRIETYTDKDGKTQTRTVTDTGWTTIAQGAEKPPFYLKDDCGAVQIRPEGAEIDLVNTLDLFCGTDEAIYYDKGPAGSISDSTHHRHFVEKALLLHAPLYVVGQAREREDIIAPEIAKDPQAPVFMISTKPEEKLVSGYFWSFWILGVIGAIFTVGGFVAETIMMERRPENEIAKYVEVGCAYICIWLGLWFWMAYNSMIWLRQRVDQAWANVDVQLKRRNDLIPNLLDAVKGYRDYEKNLQTELALLRSQLTTTAPGQTGPDPASCARSVIAIAERYPQLKANQSFLNLQHNLVDTEDRISLARGYFNTIAAHYNTRLQTIPDRYISALAGMKLRALMSAEDFERKPQKIEFAN